MTAEPTAPIDPLSFDFGINFKPSPERLDGERDERQRMSLGLLPYHVGFFDDYLRGIMRHDLVILSAESGVGKTEMATAIAMANAMDGRNAFYIALEAEPNEIERRAKYRWIAAQAAARELPFLDRLNYVDWYLGRCEGMLGNLDREADQWLKLKLRTLHTYYKGAKFDGADIRRLILAIQSQADVIVLDHLHYVDSDDENENRALKQTAKMIRDVSLGCGKPVILVVHLRKASTGRREPLVPDLDRIHGSSDIGKVATSAVMISRAPFAGSEWWKRPTLLSVPKFRAGGASPLVALCNFDVRTRAYDEHYTLGRLEDFGATWTEIEADKKPPWAKRMRHLGGISNAPPPIRGKR